MSSFRTLTLEQLWGRIEDEGGGNQNACCRAVSNTCPLSHTQRTLQPPPPPPPPPQLDAEEICSILQQAFQLVYTEATVQHLNESISAGERGSVVMAPVASTPRQRQDEPSQETGQKHGSIATKQPLHLQHTLHAFS